MPKKIIDDKNKVVKNNKKMYKSGKNWAIGSKTNILGKLAAVTATLATAGLVGTINASADTVTNSAATSSYASVSTILTPSMSSATEVLVPSSSLTSTASSINGSGINVISDSSSVITVSGESSAASVISSIANNYSSQVSSLSSAASVIHSDSTNLSSVASDLQQQADKSGVTVSHSNIVASSVDEYHSLASSAASAMQSELDNIGSYGVTGTDVYWTDGTWVEGGHGKIDPSDPYFGGFAQAFNQGAQDYDGGTDNMQRVQNGDTFIIHGLVSSNGQPVGDVKITFNDLASAKGANQFAVNFFSYQKDGAGRTALAISIASSLGGASGGMSGYTWTVAGAGDIKQVVVKDIDAGQTVTTPGYIARNEGGTNLINDNTVTGNGSLEDTAGGTDLSWTGIVVQNGQGTFHISSSMASIGSITIALFGSGGGVAKQDFVIYDIAKPDLHYSTTDLFVQELNHKDDQVNDDNGDKIIDTTDESDNGKLVSKGQTIVYPLINDDLPQYRVDDIKDYTVKDTTSQYLFTSQQMVDQALKDSNQSDLWTAVVSGGNAQGGQTITYTATKKLLDLMNADKTKAFDVPTIKMVAKPTADNETEGADKIQVSNGFITKINNKYEVESNTVTNELPDPTPHKEDNNLVGVNIDGKTVLPGSTNVYPLNWDLSVYQGIVASDDQIAKGFWFVDDYPEEVFANAENGVASATLTDSKGKAVNGVKGHVYNSISELPANIRAAVQAAIDSGKIKSFNGKFILWYAENPADFYKNYVQTGLDITIKLPLKVNDNASDVTYKNTAFQFDFGNGYQTETVSNNVPKLEDSKQVLANDDNTDINNNEIAKGDYGYYHVNSPIVPETSNGLGEPLFELGGWDVLDSTYDRYTGQYKVTSSIDIQLKDELKDTNVDLWNELHGLTRPGTNTIPKGTDLTKYLTFSYGNYKLPDIDVSSINKDLNATTASDDQANAVNKAALNNSYVFSHDVKDTNGHVYKAGTEVKAGTVLVDVVSWSFNEDFLNALTDTTGIGYSVDIQFQRMASTDGLPNGMQPNWATFRMNGVNYTTNQVQTKTPSPKTPENPNKPVKPASAQLLLPQTGLDSESDLAIAGALITALSTAGLIGASKKKKSV